MIEAEISAMEVEREIPQDMTGAIGPLFNSIPVWLETNKDKFDPPVTCNASMHGPDGQLHVTYVAGPNIRTDFSLVEGEVLLFMVKGTMYLKVQEHGELRDIMIREGDILLLPAHIPHCALRFENTIGLVIGRRNLATEVDCTRHFDDESPHNLFNPWIQQWRPTTQTTESNKPTSAESALTASAPHETDPSNLPEQYWPDDTQEVPLPYNLGTMLKVEADRIEKEGKIRLFDLHCETDVYAVGGHKPVAFEANDVAATWIWQFSGSAHFVYDEVGPLQPQSDVYTLTEGTSFFVNPGLRFAIDPQGERSNTIVITMDPRNKDRAGWREHQRVLLCRSAENFPGAESPGRAQGFQNVVCLKLI